jgi:hypothetical protein
MVKPYITGSLFTAGLSQARRSVVMDLTDVHGDERNLGSGVTRSCWGIFATNAIPITNGAALFAQTCRVNHSCSPNARYTWRADLGRELVVALKPIAAGEEVTVQYIGGCVLVL